MYGLVNKGIKDLVCNQFGEDAWEKIKETSGIDIDVFVSNSSYPDDITYKLVDAASEVLGLPAAAVLEAFGEYWVLYTGREGYGELLGSGGRTCRDFLMNLPNFHSRLSLIFPDLIPPSFKCTNIRDDSLCLQYHSVRPGLAPMVIGLLRGIGKMYKTSIEVSQTSSRDDGVNHDEFLVKFNGPLAVR